MAQSSLKQQKILIRNRDEAVALQDQYNRNQIKPEYRADVRKALINFDQHMQRISKARQQDDRGVSDWGPEGESKLTSALTVIGRRGIGNMDALATFLSGAAAEVPAGLAGLGVLGVTALANKGEANADAAADVMRHIQDAFTWNPKTAEGQELLQTVAAPLKHLDDAADYVATAAGNGNPFAEAAIYSGLMALPEVAGMVGGAGLRGAFRTSRRLQSVASKADALGLDIRQVQLPSSIIKAGARMVPEERFARTGELQEALQQAELQVRTAKKRAEGIARAKDATVKASDVKTFADNVEGTLAKEFEIVNAADEFKVLTKRINELKMLGRRRVVEDTGAIELPTRVKLLGPDEAQLRGIQLVHDLITKSLIDRKRNATENTPRILDENRALRSLQKQLDEFLDQQFNNDMIKGDVEALTKWREAGDLRKTYAKNFTEDATIMRFINNENTPAELHRWLVGANAVNAKPQVVRVVRRMKEILGDDSRAIRGLKEEFMYDLVEPLIQDAPNFELFIRRADNFVQNQKDIIRELNFNTNDVTNLRNFAHAALKTARPDSALARLDFVRNVARLLWGHGIAKAGVRVNLGTTLLQLLGRKGKLSKKQMLFEIADAMYDEPAVGRMSAGAGMVIEKYTRNNWESVERQAGYENVGNEE